MGLPTGLATKAFVPNHVRAELDLAGPIREGSPKKQAKLVQERLYLAKYRLQIDGDFGPATTRQLKNFQQKLGLPMTGVYDSKEHDLLTLPFVNAINPIAESGQSLGDMIVSVARQHIKQLPLEVGGDNRGPWVRMYMDGNEGKEWKWCAGFCFFVIEQACYFLGRDVPMEKTFTVDTIVERARNLGKFHSGQSVRPTSRKTKSRSRKAKIVPGSLFVVRAASDHWSHVGIVSRAEEDTINTCEGNTNDDGSSNGYEAIERVRNYRGKDFVIW